MPLNRLVDSNQAIWPPPDVQPTTLGLDVLSRFVCSTWDEATANGTRHFDAIVVGGGMFGGYCAEKIFRFGEARGLKVLVLEAGPFMLATHAQNLPNVGLNVPAPLFPGDDPGQARELVWGMPWRGNVPFIGEAYCLGGKSLYWGGWCPRLLASDLAGWPPTVAQYLSQNYALLEEQLGVSQDAEFIQGHLFDLLKARMSQIVAARGVANLDSIEDPPLAVQGQSPASGLFAFDKFSSIDLLINAARDASRAPDDARGFFIVPNAHVTHINSSNGVVNRVDVVVGGQPRAISVAANCAVILALGTIESTRLALWSFPSRRGNPATELMGRNLMAHWRSNTFVQIRRAALDAMNVLPRVLQTGALLVRGSTPRGKFHLQVTASADPDGNSDDLMYAMIPDIDMLKAILANQSADWISIGFRGVSQLIGDAATSVPSGGRWLNLSPYERDEYGVPRAYVQLTTSSGEDALADAMDQATLDLATALAGGNASDLRITSRGRDGLGTTYHEAGTMWMGTDPQTSVTDVNGCFHHVSNAFCADQSLFVTAGSVNPTLTGLVLARKVAEAAVALATGQPPPA